MIAELRVVLRRAPYRDLTRPAPFRFMGAFAPKRSLLVLAPRRVMLSIYTANRILDPGDILWQTWGQTDITPLGDTDYTFEELP